MSLQSLLLFGFPQGGLVNVNKPAFIENNAFSTLENAYVYRNRVIKRKALKILGRLRRVLVDQPVLPNPPGTIDLVNPSPNTFNIFTLLGLSATEPDAAISRGSLIVTVGAQTLTDVAGDGTLVVAPAGNITAATINYATGDLVISFTAPAAGLITTITVNYFPGLPVMGIWQRERADINDEQTVYWDTKYAYIFTGTNFNEFILGTTWSGTDSDFFSIANYRGINPQDRLFFSTNFAVTPTPTAANPIRYTDQLTTAWVDFAPLVSATDTLYQARIIIPYYGRLVALNVWEGTTAGGYGNSVNIANRARFSQVGNPLESTLPPPVVDLAWRSDIFGRGGFIDAPVNEDIISASFFKNTLIVQFERSTWQLRYVGEYGLPFLWERISSDFGCESTFSSIIFDDSVRSVGDRAITAASSNTVVRIDEQIPDQVFEFLNRDNGVKRIWGIRDFQQELAYWCFPDSNDLEEAQYFPNKTLLYNYRNNTYALLRNNVTAFGYQQLINSVTWDSTDILWDDMDVFWDDVDDQSKFPRVVSGNQQGYVHFYGYTSLDDVSLFITAINFLVTPVQLTIPNHNLSSQEIIYLQGAIVDGGLSSALNNQIYQVQFIDVDTVSLTQWNGINYGNVAPPVGETTYIGNGEIRLFPKMKFDTKDFNPYQENGKQTRISYIDFQTDVQPQTAGSAISVNLIINASPTVFGNLLVGNTKVENFLTPPFYTPGSFYSWHRFFAQTFGQYIRIEVTYDDVLMNELSTHQHSFELNAINLWIKEGGKLPF